MAVVTGLSVAGGIAAGTAVAGVAVAAKSASDAKKDASKGRKQQELENAANRGMLKEARDTARGDVERLMPEAQVLRGLGAQNAIDIFGSSLPHQFGAFQQGNMDAQQMVMGGLQQQNNAIMGMPVDYSGFQPTQMESDFSWLPNQLPDGIIGSLMQGYGGEPDEPNLYYGGHEGVQMGMNQGALVGYDQSMQRKFEEEEAAIAARRAQTAQQFQGAGSATGQYPNQQVGMADILAGKVPFMPYGG